MLNAILHSKDKSVDGYGNFRLMYKNIEDFFTAVVFSRITYLPIAEQARIFFLITNDKRFLSIKKLKKREFWPRWSAMENDEYMWKEPDLYLHFDVIDLVVEAKRDDNTPHNRNQLLEELSISEIYAKNDFILLAVGGGTDLCHEKVIYVTWSKIFKIVQEMGMEETRWIYEDLIQAFYLHGFYPTQWMESLPSLVKKVKIDRFNNSVDFLKRTFDETDQTTN